VQHFVRRKDNNANLFAFFTPASIGAIAPDGAHVGFHIDALVFRDDCHRAASKQWRAFIWRDA
jgi:hypothetical protein